MENNFEKIILDLEKENLDGDFTFINGKMPVLLSAPHTMEQKKEDGTVKLPEPYTKAIALYVSKKLNCYCFIKNRDTGIDPNSEKMEKYKREIIDCINRNNIKLVIDLHGASELRNFDVEFGTINNLSVDFSTVKELEEAFIEQGVNNVVYNDPFKGGGVTKSIYGKTKADVIQIEINKKYRNIKDSDKIQKICDALITFLNLYINK